MKASALLVVVLPVVVSACSTIEEDKYSFRQGWRQAQVRAIVQKATVVPYVDKDCRLDLGPDATFLNYAVASYSVGGRQSLRLRRVVAVPKEMDLKVREWIYVNVTDCKKSIHKVEFG